MAHGRGDLRPLIFFRYRIGKSEMTLISSDAPQGRSRVESANFIWKELRRSESEKILDKEVNDDYSIIVKLSNYTKIFKALSNEQRLKIFMMLYKNCCVPEGSRVMAEFSIKGEPCRGAEGSLEKAFTKICDCMNLSRSTISHHFKELQNAGLITCEREGQLYRCRVNKHVIDSIKSFLE